MASPLSLEVSQFLFYKVVKNYSFEGISEDKDRKHMWGN